jgi:glutathione peroxidase
MTSMKPLLLIGFLSLMTTSALSAASLYDVTVKDINEKATPLKSYEGKVLLIVNVASRCGYTPQYKGLQALYEKHQAKGLVILGFPCNQFGGQEPGTNEEIKQFCSSKFNVTFPLFDKIAVNGPDRSPLYTALAGEGSPFPGDIKWNFTKFLVGRDGHILKRFESGVDPGSAELEEAVTAALGKK